MSASIVTISTPLTVQNGIDERRGGEAADRTSRTTTPGRLRLTRRGRAVFGTLATLTMLGVLALFAMFSGSQAVASANSSNSDFGYVIVEPGSSLWQVARQIDPAADPRELVDEIIRLNQLETSGVQAGQPVAVPLRYAESSVVVSASELGL